MPAIKPNRVIRPTARPLTKIKPGSIAHQELVERAKTLRTTRIGKTVRSWQEEIKKVYEVHKTNRLINLEYYEKTFVPELLQLSSSRGIVQYVADHPELADFFVIDTLNSATDYVNLRKMTDPNLRRFMTKLEIAMRIALDDGSSRTTDAISESMKFVRDLIKNKSKK